MFLAPRALIVANHASEVPGALAAMAGARDAGFWLAGYASYELGYALMPKLRDRMPAGRDTPLLVFGVFATPEPAAELPAGQVSLAAAAPRWERENYRRAFGHAHEYISAGDIYQVNLTFPLDGRYDGAAAALYARLAAHQPVRHGALVDLGVGPMILSRSPELFFRTDSDGWIETRPMKGTVARERDAAADQRQRDWLQRDGKNRAENLMIVDLLRNDLSRICQIGSVEVPELFAIETYATVHQMVSRVRGRLLAGTGLPEIFSALFPCGSITGAPKLRAMEIIHELEPAPRGVYCGAIGWAAPDGTASFNVAIRTLSLFDDGRVRLNVGGGVVYDSTAESEYGEALLKARFAELP